VDYIQAFTLNSNFVFMLVMEETRGALDPDPAECRRLIGVLTQVITQNPNIAEVWYFRGQAYDSLKDYNRAVADFEAALRLDPNNAHYKSSLESARYLRRR
jgi:cytochrome c-type biogenesis protein CcmH/NrfG